MYLIDIINTDNEPNIIEQIMAKEKPKQIENEEWLYKGCFIQKRKHPFLFGNYSVFKNNEYQTHINNCITFKEAKKLCELNECHDNYLKF